MPMPSEELGVKVLRARQALDRIRGVARAGGVDIEVDAQGRLESVVISPSALDNGPQALSDLVLRVYRQALDQAVPRAAAAMQELMDDPQVARIADMTVDPGHFPAATSRDSRPEAPGVGLDGADSSPGLRPQTDAGASSRQEKGVVGPSDWPDDYDDYPSDKPWWR